MPAPVIVVHNYPEIRDAAVAALRAAGYETIGFDDPMTALDAMDLDNTRIRVLVTRVFFGQGKLNGVALARMIRYKQPGLKVLFVALPEYMDEARKVGVALPLPLDPDTLVATVSGMLEGGSDLSRGDPLA